MAGEVVTVRVENLAEIKSALRKVDRGLPKYVGRGLRASAKIVSQEARGLQAAEFEGTRAGALVPGAERLAGIVKSRGSLHQRGDFGLLIMRRVLLPARAAKVEEAKDLLDEEIGRLKREAGF